MRMKLLPLRKQKPPPLPLLHKKDSSKEWLLRLLRTNFRLRRHRRKRMYNASSMLPLLPPSSTVKCRRTARP